jgi:lipopolysaccharide/colanic/teichoic acid biosynthesis glycosyltransferase
MSVALESLEAMDLGSRTKPAARAAEYAGKVWLDRLAGVALLVAAAPMIAGLWLVVRLTSRGPGFYRQRRAGLGGREFMIVKLRTMPVDCERQTGAVWATRQDARATLVGGFLRTSHLDELPQLWNVVCGDMSLVGPRPERPEIIKRLVPEIPEYLDRLCVRPGVTGLAQLSNGPDRTIQDVRHKLRYDFRYLGCQALGLDLRIMLCTALKVVGLNRPAIRRRLVPETRLEHLPRLPVDEV